MTVAPDEPLPGEPTDPNADPDVPELPDDPDVDPGYDVPPAEGDPVTRTAPL